MSLAIIYRLVLEREIKILVKDLSGEIPLKPPWNRGFTFNQTGFLKTVTEHILDLQDNFKVIMLGYGRCQAMDRLPSNFKIPLFYPQADVSVSF